MASSTILLDPTDERTPAVRERTPRPQGLQGLTLGLLDISKPRGDVFLEELEGLLTARGASVRRYAKPTFARPAPTALQQQIATECDLLLEALAD